MEHAKQGTMQCFFTLLLAGFGWLGEITLGQWLTIAMLGSILVQTGYTLWKWRREAKKPQSPE